MHQVMGQFSTSAQQVTQEATTMADMAGESQEIISEFETDFSTFYQNATDTHAPVSLTQTIADALLSKMDHVIYI